MGILRGDDMLVVQLQGADEGRLQFRQEMKGAAQEGHVSPDGLAAGQAADGLVDDSLKNRRGQVFLGRALVDQWLNIGFGKYAAAGGDGVKRLIIFRVFIQSGGVRLEK